MCEEYFLEFVNDDEGNLRQIDQPTGWTDLTLNIGTEDPCMFGRNFTFSDSTIPLEFEKETSAMIYGHQFDEMLRYFNCYGQGSCIRFHRKFCDVITILGALNFIDPDTDGCNYFKVNLIQEQKSNTILQNNEVSADLTSLTTLNGEASDPLLYETMCLKGRALITKASQGAEDSFGNNPYFDNFKTIKWSTTTNGARRGSMPLMNLDVSTDSNIENNLFNSSGLPLSLSEYSYSFDSGISSVNVNIFLDFGLAVAIGSNNIEDINFELKLLHRDFEGNVKSETTLLSVLDIDNIVGSIISVSDPNIPLDDLITDSEFTNYIITHQTTITGIDGADTLTLYAAVSGNPDFNIGPKILRLWTRVQDTSFFNVDGLSVKPDSEHEIPRLKDVFAKQIDIISDGCVTVKMPEFEQGGEFYDYFLPTGYIVRNDALDRQYSVSFELLMESVNAIFCAGYQIYDDCIFIGTVKEFYKPINCGLLDYPVVEYEETFDKDLQLNKFEFKYNKIPKDDINTIDEFNTKAEYHIPTDKVKGSLKKESKFIASGVKTELERRKQFTEEPTTSSENDDDVFIVNGIFDQTLGKYVNRTNEQINPINNLISPETAYNIAISPLQNFSRWWRYVGSSTYYKNKSDTVKTTFFEANEFFESAVLDSSTLSTLQVQKGEYEKSIFVTYIFEPKRIDAKLVGVSLGAYKQIEEDLKLKRGYFQIRNKKGELQDIYILEAEYNVCKEELTIIKSLKKNPDYV